MITQSKQEIKNIYKIYQLMEFFVNKHGFNNVMVKNYLARNEIWLANAKSEYNIIRITCNPIDDDINQEKRINTYIDAIALSLKLKSKFLNIHIGNEELKGDELFSTVSIDTNYYSGIELDSIYPLIKNVIYESSDPEKDIQKSIKSVNDNLKVRYRQNKEIFKQKFKFNATSIVMLICLIVYLAQLIITNKTDYTSAMIIMGADYKFFTLGLNQYWRLLTGGLVHYNLLHFVCNMYSFFYLGNIVEKKIGPLKFIIVLICGIVVGNITTSIFMSNGMTCGISGGLYALFMIYIIDAIRKGAYQDRSFIFLIGFNIMLNFMSNVAWQAHLGGAVVGMIFFYMFDKNVVDYKMILLLIVMLSALTYKYINSKPIYPLYGLTDQAVIDSYNKLGLDSIASSLQKEIYTYYSSN